MRCIYDTQTQWYFITQFNVVDVNRYVKYCSNYSKGRVTIDNNVNEVISCKPYSLEKNKWRSCQRSLYYLQEKSLTVPWELMMSNKFWKIFNCATDWSKFSRLFQICKETSNFSWHLTLIKLWRYKTRLKILAASAITNGRNKWFPYVLIS